MHHVVATMQISGKWIAAERNKLKMRSTKTDSAWHFL